MPVCGMPFVFFFLLLTDISYSACNILEEKDILGIAKGEAVLSLLHRLGWTDIVIFHDSCTGKEISSILPDDDTGRKFVQYNVDYLNQSTVDSIMDTLFYVKKRRNLNFLLMSNGDATKYIVQQGVNWANYSRLNYLIMSFCKWLFVGFSHELQASYDHLKSFHNAAMLEFSAESTQASLYAQVWQAKTNKQHLIWTGDIDNIATFPDELFSNPKNNLHGMHLHVSLLPFANAVIRKTVQGFPSYTGLCIDLLETLAVGLNFTTGGSVHAGLTGYLLVEPHDGQFGALKDGQWSGMVGEVYRGNVDFALGPLSIEAKRSEAIDFTIAYLHDMTVMTYKHDKFEEQGKDMVIRPFHWLIYLFVLVCVLFTTMLYLMMEKWSQLNIIKHDENGRGTGTSNPTKAFLFIFGGLLKQGTDYKPMMSSTRILLAFWWIFAIVISASYSCNLVAFLATTKEMEPFSTLNELVELNTFTWGMMNGSFTETIFKSSKKEPLTTAWSKSVSFSKSDPETLSSNFTVLYNKMMTSPFVFIGSRTGVAVSAQSSCDVVIVEDNILTNQAWAIGVQKDSPLRDIIGDRIQDLYELGVINQWEDKWNRIAECKINASYTDMPVTLLSLEVAFYILLLGTVLSFIVLGSEMRLHRLLNIYRKDN